MIILTGKNHKWKKFNRRYEYIETREEHTELIVTPSKQYECIKCGLRKGYVESNSRHYGMFRGMELVYFDKDKILSRRTLPFGCSSMNYIATQSQDNSFIKKEDFQL